jgi:hypothetical protein
MVAADVHQESTAGLGVECLGGRGTVRSMALAWASSLSTVIGGTASGHVGLQIG